jgi:hypothetical protein
MAQTTSSQHNTLALQHACCQCGGKTLAGNRSLFIRAELGPRLQAARASNEVSHFPARIKMGADEKSIEVSIRPLLSG